MGDALYLQGYHWGVSGVDFGGGPIGQGPTPESGEHYLVALDAEGRFDWQRVWEGGSVWYPGFAGPSGDLVFATALEPRWEIQSIDASNVEQWRRVVSSMPISIAIDYAGRVYVSEAATLLCLDDSGNELWERALPPARRAYGAVAHPTGGVVVAQVSVETFMGASGVPGAWLTRYDEGGDVVWDGFDPDALRLCVPEEEDCGEGVEHWSPGHRVHAVGPDGAVYVGGHLPGPLDALQGYVARIDPPE